VGVSSLSALTAGKFIVAKGPLLNVPGSVSPAIGAVQIRTKQ
jgi:hypothetical protein